MTLISEAESSKEIQVTSVAPVEPITAIFIKKWMGEISKRT